MDWIDGQIQYEVETKIDTYLVTLQDNGEVELEPTYGGEYVFKQIKLDDIAYKQVGEDCTGSAVVAIRKIIDEAEAQRIAEYEAE